MGQRVGAEKPPALSQSRKMREVSSHLRGKGGTGAQRGIVATGPVGGSVSCAGKTTDAKENWPGM